MSPDVSATTANGDLRVACAERGLVQLKTALGRIDVGIRTGTAAQVDLHTSFGTVRNHLETVQPPAASETTLQVHIRTSAGDIEITRVSFDES